MLLVATLLLGTGHRHSAVPESPVVRCTLDEHRPVQCLRDVVTEGSLASAGWPIQAQASFSRSPEADAQSF